MQTKKKLILLAQVTTIAALLLCAFFMFPVFAARNLKNTFTDKFSSNKLNPAWTIADPDGGSTFDLSANKGWLRITSPSGRDLLPVKFNAPRIYQSVSGDFTVETKISAETNENDEGAGILVWIDQNNFVRLDRMSRTIGNPVQQQILFGGSVGGVWPCPGDTHTVLASNINPTYLKLTKTQGVIIGWYSADGAAWTQVGTIPFEISDPIKIGLAVINEYHTGYFYADFDYFQIDAVETEEPSTPIVYFDRFNKPKLDSSWTIVDPIGDATFSLRAEHGFLRITSPPDRDLAGGNVNAPRAVITGVSGNFEVETKVIATTDENDEGAGILVWNDSSNYIRFERISRTLPSNPVYQEILFSAGGSNYIIVMLQTNLNPTYLRLVKTNGQFSGFYSADGTTWTSVGTLSITLGDTVDVGLAVVNMYHSNTFYADFDYFSLTANP